MSIIFKKENGYPVDLEIKANIDGEWVQVSIFINGKEQEEEAFDTKYPIETRKAWARGFFAGYEFTKKEYAIFDPTCRLCGDILTSEELICETCATAKGR